MTDIRIKGQRKKLKPKPKQNPAHVQRNYLNHKKGDPVFVKLSTGDEFTGTLIADDTYTLFIETEERKVLIYKSSMAFIHKV